MTTYPFNLNIIDPSWQTCINQALGHLDHDYLHQLARSNDWLPGPQRIFNAFSLPLHHVNYVLLGESPYPRRESANGYAFWDGSVKALWSEKGMSKQVNRATSLRNILKMLMVAEGLITKKELGQQSIAKANKQHLVQTNDEFFGNFIKHGFLLLNASLVLQARPVQKDAKAWAPFITQLFDSLLECNPQVKFILLGRIAHSVDKLISHSKINKLVAEHPYNLSFITNQKVLDFFRPLHLLVPMGTK